MKRLLTLSGIILSMLLPSIAFAHQASGGGFLAGLSHPVLGFDHLLAMLSVGILSAQMGGRALWLVPTTFVSIMLVGGILGLNGFALISVETGISISVLVLGISLTIEKKIAPILAMCFVGFFAIFHGYAHGIEMPNLASPIYYALGFIVGTASIHVIGVLIGTIAVKLANGAQLLRYLGAGIAGIGFHLVIM